MNTTRLLKTTSAYISAGGTIMYYEAGEWVVAEQGRNGKVLYRGRSESDACDAYIKSGSLILNEPAAESAR